MFTLERSRTGVNNVGKLFLRVMALNLTSAFTLERSGTGVNNVGKLFLRVVPLKPINAFTLERSCTGVNNVVKCSLGVVTLKDTSSFTLPRSEHVSEPSCFLLPPPPHALIAVLLYSDLLSTLKADQQ